MLTTTYALLQKRDACEDRYAHLKKSLRERGHRGSIPLSLILETNGLDDALWALRAVPKAQEKDRDKIARLFACECAEAVLPVFEAAYPDDKRPRQTIEVARRFAHGDATCTDLAAAARAAWAAEGDAWIARTAARAAEAAAWAAEDAAWVAEDAADGVALADQSAILMRLLAKAGEVE